MSGIAGGIVLEKKILILKLGSKFNMCDRIIFDLVQCGIHEARRISGILDIFPCEFIAESLAKLHNKGLIYINMNNGEILLTSEVQKIIEEQKEGQLSLGGQDDGVDSAGQMMKNFSGLQKVML